MWSSLCLVLHLCHELLSIIIRPGSDSAKYSRLRLARSQAHIAPASQQAAGNIGCLLMQKVPDLNMGFCIARCDPKGCDLELGCNTSVALQHRIYQCCLTLY
jgi:hypothetical protein